LPALILWLLLWPAAWLPSREKADAFSRKTRRAFVDDQARADCGPSAITLHEQFQASASKRFWEKQLGVFLRVATAVMGLAIAGGPGLHGCGAPPIVTVLRIEPFFRGLPTLVAKGPRPARFIAAKSAGPAYSDAIADPAPGVPPGPYSNAWGDHGIKLEIPETGMSVAELDGWLREKLGHDTRVYRRDRALRHPAITIDRNVASEDGAAGNRQPAPRRPTWTS